MKVLIETKYTLFGEEGEMFNETTASTEIDCHDINEFETLVDIQTEKEADRERIIRVQLKDLLADKGETNEKENDMSGASDREDGYGNR